MRPARAVPVVLVLVLVVAAGAASPAPRRRGPTRKNALSEQEREMRFEAEEGAIRSAQADPAEQVPTGTSSDGAFKWESRAVANNSPFGEPSIDLDHKGGVYITAPGGAGVQMWRSFDGGETFDYKEIGSDNGGGDSEIEFNLKDVGFVADLEIQDSAISRSTDRFETFEQQDVGIEQDRQWLSHRCNDTIYLVYHDFAAELELLNRSDDGGETWSVPPVPVGNPGDAPGGQDMPVAGDQGVNTFSGPMAVNQKNGDVYVVYAISSAEGNVVTGTPPFGEPEQIIVGVSHDEGQSFELKLIQGGEVGTLAGLLFPWITIDKAGNVYVSFAGRQDEESAINVFLAYSTDRGDTWSEPYRVNKDSTGHSHIYTTISAGDPGVVDMAWYTGSDPDPNVEDQDWYVDFAQVREADSRNPKVSQSRVFEDTIHHGSICLEGTLCVTGGDRSLLDFFQIQVDQKGMAHLAFANNGTPADDVQRIWYAKQTGGRSAGNAMHDTQFCGKQTGGGGELPGPRVRLNVSDKTPARGEDVTFRARLEVCTGSHRGTQIQLRRKKGEDYVPIATKRLNNTCKARFTLRATWKSKTFKAWWPKQDDDHRQGRSKPRTVVTH